MFDDSYTGIPRWRERAQRRRRKKGVWDPKLERQTYVFRESGREITYFVDGPQQQPQSLKEEEEDEHQRQQLPHIFVFHAMCLSGNSFIMEDPPTNFVMVAINRPGYFGSSPVDNSEYGYEQFARDVEELALNALGIDKFSVVGHSSGGPCALACAALLPHRVSSFALLASDPEYAVNANASSSSTSIKSTATSTAATDSSPSRSCHSCHNHQHQHSLDPMQEFCLGTCLPFTLNWMVPFLPMARGMRNGLVLDYTLERQPYPFQTEKIRQPGLVCCGDHDCMVPPYVAKGIYDRLPTSSSSNSSSTEAMSSSSESSNNNNNNKATVTSATIKSEFRVFKGKCHMKLLQDSVLNEVFEKVLWMADQYQQHSQSSS